ncbi:histone deacetylase 9 [Galendromus occidentalis]|uniref:Histone deacetylase 9 n=1 Tax=Galendromus occidentalis TaxID=34638 RepID=A0AAJ6QMP6_9ACAR|nr:histone deacetylase 9 [Galendromus occidentalis]
MVLFHKPFAGGPDTQEYLMGGALVVDPALREEVSAVQLELQKQILVLQQEQQMQQQILLQHFQLQQRHLQQQHEKHLSERIRMYMESHKTRSDSSAHSDEDRDSGHGSDKEVSVIPQEYEMEAPVVSSTPTATKCPKKDVLRKLEEEERMRSLIAAKATKTNAPKTSTSPAPKIVVLPKKNGSGASIEVRAKLQQFLAKRQEQRTRSKVVPGVQRPRQKSSSSERSTTSSLSGSESPPAKATTEEVLGSKPASGDLSLKLKSSLRQKVMEGRLSPISKTEQKLKKADINCHVPVDEARCRPTGGAPELPKQRKNEMFQMISMLLGQ